MKRILRSTRSKVIVASLAVAVVAGGAGVYAYQVQNHSVNQAAVSSATDVDTQVTPTASPVESPSSTPAPVASQQPETSATPEASATPTSSPSNDAQLDTQCDSVTKYIDHFMDAQSNGHSTYSSADEFMNSVTKRNNPAMYALYQQCVAAGKM